MNQPENRIRLLSDVAIAEVQQDRLDRAPFAKSLARSIHDLDTRDSFVFGLCGPWGSGKTSVLNLVLAELKRRAVSAVQLSFTSIRGGSPANINCWSLF